MRATGARILVIEHQAADRDAITGHLAKTKHELVFAANKAEGIALARRGSLQLILCALSAPSNGVEVFLTLRTDKAFDEVPIVAVTKFSSPEDHNHLRALGFAGVIPKPVSADFITQVEGFLPPPKG